MIKTFLNSCLDGIEKQLDQLLHLKEDVWYPFSQTEINQSNLAATKKQEADLTLQAMNYSSWKSTNGSPNCK
jgi:hypothetical protein